MPPAAAPQPDQTDCPSSTGQTTPAIRALLVLGGECSQSMQRSRRALQGYRQCLALHQPAPLFILSGGNLQKRHGLLLPECEQMRRFLRAAGVPDCHIVTDAISRDTYANLLIGGMLAQEKGIGIQHTAIVTDAYHAPRIRRLHRLIYGHPPAAMQLACWPSSAWQKSREHLAYLALRSHLWWHGIAHGKPNDHWQYLQNYHPLHYSLQ